MFSFTVSDCTVRPGKSTVWCFGIPLLDMAWDGLGIYPWNGNELIGNIIKLIFLTTGLGFGGNHGEPILRQNHMGSHIFKQKHSHQPSAMKPPGRASPPLGHGPPWPKIGEMYDRHEIWWKFKDIPELFFNLHRLSHIFFHTLRLFPV